MIGLLYSMRMRCILSEVISCGILCCCGRCIAWAPLWNIPLTGFRYCTHSLSIKYAGCQHYLFNFWAQIQSQNIKEARWICSCIKTGLSLNLLCRKVVIFSIWILSESTENSALLLFPSTKEDGQWLLTWLSFWKWISASIFLIISHDYSHTSSIIIIITVIKHILC